MIALQSVAATLLLALAIPAAAAEATFTRRTPLTHYGANAAIELRGSPAAATVEFGSRADELVTRAVLHLRYAHSPALAPSVAHIRVSLNDEPIGVLPVTADGAAGRMQELDLAIDPRLVAGSNKLVLELVPARGASPEDASRPGLWADVSGASELELELRPIAVADELGTLPEPFFDKRDQRRLTLPFVFAEQPAAGTLRAAAVVASWFGRHAAWRGARFPASLGEAPPGHAVVVATNSERPAFLKGLAAVDGPQIRMSTNPADGRSKLLLVLGRDAADVKAAADALVLGGFAMSGAVAKVKPAAERAPRAAYDAPGVVKTDRAMKLGELIGWPQQLEASGTPPELPLIKVDLRAPPDLATARWPGVPLRLKLQYTPPACANEAQLAVSVNDELLQVVNLPLGAQAIADTKEVFIPSYRLRGRMRLQLGYRFGMQGEGPCRDARPAPVKARVSPESTIDFSGFPHFAQLPDMRFFATVGYPFTRYADLSQTVVVLPERPTPPDVESMLTLVGRMGEATGYPATHVRVMLGRDEAQLKDADVLLVGAAIVHPLLARWAEGLPTSITGQTRRVAPGAGVIVPVSFESDGPLAAMVGFESPVSKGRSVVAVTAIVPDQLRHVLDALEDSDHLKAMGGGAAFVFPNKVESLPPPRTYSLGFLPPWAGAGHWLSERPGLVASVGGFILLVIAYTAWAVRRSRARPATA